MPGRPSARRRRRRVALRSGAAALVALLAVVGILLATRPHHRGAPAPERASPHRATPAKPVAAAALRVPAPQPPPASAMPAWLRFAAPAPPAGGRPLVAIVIDDLGLDRRRTAAVIGLPGPLTLSFMTYADELAEQTAAARRAGDELLLHVPMQPLDRREDPGPHALKVAMQPAEIRAQLRWGLDRFSGYVGVNNHMGSRFTADVADMAVVMGELRDRGLLFLDSRTSAASVGMRAAAAAGVPHVRRDVFLDDVPVPSAIDRQLARVEETARRTGSAIAIGHARNATIAALRAWLPTLPEQRLVLVPLTAVVRDRMSVPGQTGR